VYRLFVAIGLINNYAALVLVYIAIVAPFITWFLKTYFDTLPIELDEAAAIYGCTPAGGMWRVVLPSARPGIVSAGSIVAILPVVLIFIILQRQIVGALTAGAVKG
jgi:multiple sugar transport system permease protein